MILKKVMLCSGGNKGMNLVFDGYRKVGDNYMSGYEDSRKDKMPVPLNVRKKFDNLKYFFLQMLGVWDDDLTILLDDYYSRVINLDKYMEDNPDGDKNLIAGMMMRAETLLEKTVVNGFEFNGGEIKIFGTYENIEGKPYLPRLPFISEDDDYAFYQETMSVMKDIASLVMKYMHEEKIELEEIKSMLLELQSINKEDVERIEKQTDEENYLEFMNKLEGQALVFPLEGSELEKLIEKNDDAPKMNIVGNKTFSGGRVDEHEEIEEMEGQVDKEDKEEKEWPDKVVDEDIIPVASEENLNEFKNDGWDIEEENGNKSEDENNDLDL